MFRILFVLSNLEQKDLIPNYSLTTSGGVSDLVLKMNICM